MSTTHSLPPIRINSTQPNLIPAQSIPTQLYPVQFISHLLHALLLGWLKELDRAENCSEGLHVSLEWAGPLVSGVGGALFQFGELGYNLACRKQRCLGLSGSHPSYHWAPQIGPSLKARFTTGRSLQLISSQSKCLLRSLKLSALFCVLATTINFCLSPVFPGCLPSLRPTGVGGEMTKEPHGTLWPSWRDS